MVIHDIYINNKALDITELKTKHMSFSKGNQIFKLVMGKVKKKQIDLAYNSMEKAEKKAATRHDFKLLMRILQLFTLEML